MMQTINRTMALSFVDLTQTLFRLDIVTAKESVMMDCIFVGEGISGYSKH